MASTHAYELLEESNTLIDPCRSNIGGGSGSVTPAALTPMQIGHFRLTGYNMDESLPLHSRGVSSMDPANYYYYYKPVISFD